MHIGGDETALLADQLPLDDLVAGFDKTLCRRTEMLAHGDDERSGKRNGLYRLVAGKILVIFGMNTAVKPEG